MSDSIDSIKALAKRFIDAIEDGRPEIAEAIYADDAKIWHNHDGVVQSRDENLKTLRGFIAGVPKRKYAERRVTAYPGGFVHQHVLVAENTKGKAIALACCLVCTVENGRITRLDEYFDSAPLKAWMG